MTTAEDFRKFGKEMIDYLADYMENIADRKVVSEVTPGYLRPLMAENVPNEPANYKEVMEDLEKLIMPGITHWQHPNFHAYFSAGRGYPSILADLVSASFGCNGFSWAASPAYTELEMQMVDWTAKLINLPDQFLLSHEGPGGGVLQGTASESCLVVLLAARNEYQKRTGDEVNNFSRLVGYTSEYAHSSVDRAGLLAGVTIRHLDTDENFALNGETLKIAIAKDKKAGLIPCFCCATLGTTTSVAFDHLDEIGKVCNEEDVWLHVDAAYAGAAFACEEYVHLMKGVERVDSFVLNLHKLLLVGFDCAALWLKDSRRLTDEFNVNPVYLSHENKTTIPDYRHWQIPLGKRFRALKVWFTLRLYGVSGVQTHIRQHVHLAKVFEKLARENCSIEIVAPVILGLVCFRMLGTDEENELLLKNILKEGKIHLVPSRLNGRFMFRFAICDGNREEDIVYGYNIIKEQVSKLKNKSEIEKK